MVAVLLALIGLVVVTVVSIITESGEVREEAKPAPGGRQGAGTPPAG